MSDIKQYIAEKAASIVNGARRKGYGTPAANFHRIALMWQAWFDARGLRIVHINELALDQEDLKEYRFADTDISPMMRLVKEARLIETPAHLDSLLDLVGYTLTGAEINGAHVPDDVPLTREEMAEYKRKFSDLLDEKNKQIASLEKQIEHLVSPKAELTTALADQDETLSLARQAAQAAIDRSVL